MNRLGFALLAAAGWIAATSEAEAVGLSAYGVATRSGNETWNSLSNGTQDGPGFRLDVEAASRWHLFGFVDGAAGNEDDYDPTGSGYRPNDPTDPEYYGNVRSYRDATWAGLGIRFDAISTRLSEKGAFWRLYVHTGGALVSSRLRLSDNYASISDLHNAPGWRVGGGTEMIWAWQDEPDDKSLGIFLEMERREFKPRYEVGLGFGPRLDVSLTWLFGLSAFVFE